VQIKAEHRAAHSQPELTTPIGSLSAGDTLTIALSMTAMIPPLPHLEPMGPATGPPIKVQVPTNALVVIDGPTPGLSATRKPSRNGVVGSLGDEARASLGLGMWHAMPAYQRVVRSVAASIDNSRLDLPEIRCIKPRVLKRPLRFVAHLPREQEFYSVVGSIRTSVAHVRSDFPYA